MPNIITNGNCSTIGLWISHSYIATLDPNTIYQTYAFYRPKKKLTEVVKAERIWDIILFCSIMPDFHLLNFTIKAHYYSIESFFRLT